jgi:hypothetical protein
MVVPLAQTRLHMDFPKSDSAGSDFEKYAYDIQADMWYGLQSNEVPIKYFTWEELFEYLKNREACGGLRTNKISDERYAIPYEGMSTWDGKSNCGYHVLDRATKTTFVIRYESTEIIGYDALNALANLMPTLTLPDTSPLPPQPAQPQKVTETPVFTDTAGWQTYTDPVNHYKIQYPADWTASSTTFYSPKHDSVGIVVEPGAEASHACQLKAFELGDSLIEFRPEDGNNIEKIGTTAFRILNEHDYSMNHGRDTKIYITSTDSACYGIWRTYDYSGCGPVDMTPQERKQCEEDNRKSILETATLLENVARTFQLTQ